MKKIIIDCDNTFGVTGCDLDDGLAIIYTFGTKRAAVLGITTTFGNNTLEVVHPNTVSFMEKIGKSDIPVVRGHHDDASQNAAAKYLVEMANTYPDELTLLVIGSVTNLYHAWQLDAAFFDKIAEISFMGGVTEPLIIEGKQLNELNFACNSEAAYHVLTKGKNIHIATGNLCLDALFTKARFDQLAESDHEFLQWLHEQGQYWFTREKEVFGHDGIYKWDIYAAAVLCYPELFVEDVVEITPTLASMKIGMLLGGGAAVKVNLPVLKDSAAFIRHICEMYVSFAASK